MHTLPAPRIARGPSVRALLAALVLALPAHTAAQGPPVVRFAAWRSGSGSDPAAALADKALLIPVRGVRPEQLRDTYHAERDGGREHLAIDIPAPRGTPVLAAADGRILKLHSGSRGGTALYQLDADGRTRYYYAHLDGYAEGVYEGRPVRRGDVIGYVGDSGNAAPGDTHLHFSIAILSDVRRWWEGDNLDPYPVLRGAAPGATGVTRPFPPETRYPHT